MLFTQTVRYPLYESIYAQEGEVKDVPSNLVERMIKRGAVLKEEKVIEADNSENLGTIQTELTPDEPKVDEGPKDDLGADGDLDSDADLLGGDPVVDAENNKTDETQIAESPKASNKNKNKDKNK